MRYEDFYRPHIVPKAVKNTYDLLNHNLFEKQCQKDKICGSK
jgi:hypothetical protein